MKFSDLNTEKKPVVQLNPNSWKAAQDFAYEKMCERAIGLGLDKPFDLSQGCKFSSLFVQQIFGGKIEGNEFHYFNRIRGKIHDLNEFAFDVSNLDDPYKHDPREIMQYDYLISLESCLPRVKKWVVEFTEIAKDNNWIVCRARKPERQESLGMSM
ncbi:hypothetical protein RYA05_13820 [Pseudomonas syringae pv. actinidiae]|nr:hypothetical protein [Pseudomonas syringae pv. actinidiae]